MMDTTLLAPTEWAQTEFGASDLGDRRRTCRLVRVAARLANGGGGTLPAAFDTRAELEGAYRLLEREATTHAQIIAPHTARVRRACREPGEYLMVEDTTALDFSAHRATEDLGRIGNDDGRGLLVHSTLALRVARWTGDYVPEVTVVGLFAQQPWTRTGMPIGSHEKRAARHARARESERWAVGVTQVAPPPETVAWTYTADRDSDVWEVFARCREHGWHYIVRANQARALATEAGSVFTAVAAAPERGRYALKLRARPGVAARQPTVAVRSVTAPVRAPWRPGGQIAPERLTFVEAREVDPPAGVSPIHWVLVTDWPAESLEQARRVIGAYTRRWLIEEYHKGLKSGTGIEQSQLTTAGRIEALPGILSVVAARLLDRKLLAATLPDAPAAAEHLPAGMLPVLEAKYGRPAEGWTNRTVLVAIAKLGGFMARKGDGLPGWTILWRGWDKLIALCEGYHLAIRERCE